MHKNTVSVNRWINKQILVFCIQYVVEYYSAIYSTELTHATNMNESEANYAEWKKMYKYEC